MHVFSILENAWIVLGSLGSYQLYLQLVSKGRTPYAEGFIKLLQYMVGIPAITSLAVFLCDPDELTFVFIHMSRGVVIVGLPIFNLAALSIIWAHVHLGRFWSGDLETLPDHRLINTGPYYWIRHPLYTSYLFLTLGLFLMTGDWLVGGSMFLYFLTVAARTYKEEEMLLEQLGDHYGAYRANTGRFLPVFSRLSRN